MTEFSDAIGELLTREYGSTVDHAVWCGEQDGVWQECERRAQHDDAGMDILLRVTIMRANGEPR